MTKLKLFPSCSHILFSSLLSFFCRAEIVKLYSMIKTLDSVLKSDQENFVYRNFLNLVLFRAVYGFVSRLCVTRRDETIIHRQISFHFILFGRLWEAWSALFCIQYAFIDRNAPNIYIHICNVCVIHGLLSRHIHPCISISISISMYIVYTDREYIPCLQNGITRSYNINPFARSKRVYVYYFKNIWLRSAVGPKQFTWNSTKWAHLCSSIFFLLTFSILDHCEIDFNNLRNSMSSNDIKNHLILWWKKSIENIQARNRCQINDQRK